MTTVMIVKNSAGVRRCDETCHDAKSKACACVCEGRYHGRGEDAQKMVQQDVAKGAFKEKNVSEVADLLSLTASDPPKRTAKKDQLGKQMLEAGETREAVREKTGYTPHQVWELATEAGFVQPRSA